MFLSKIELQGFKTFANKTTLSFLSPKTDSFPLTAIVGPNGSGKSNLADAVRWALGEQSLKLLRGKDSTDVIFSGSTGKGRSGFAEVIMTFDNTDNTIPLETSDVTVTRRLYRDGDSEYLVNNKKTRLQDIHLMLAQANVGQRSYSVIGQGMVDTILTSTPQERKVFFDDATGVRQFQIKRHQAMLKLKRTYENLAETEMVLREIQPRLRLLSRQTKRLEKRSEVELTLKERQTKYFQSLWFQLADDIKIVRDSFDKIDSIVGDKRDEMKKLEKTVAEMEEIERKGGSEDSELKDLRTKLREAESTRRKIRDEEFSLQKELELSKVRAQANWSPLPLVDITKELEGIIGEQQESLKSLRGLKSLDGLKSLITKIESLFKRSEKLSKSLKRPAAEDVKPDPKLVTDLKKAQAALKDIDASVKKLYDLVESHTKKENKKRTELFSIERSLREKQHELYKYESEKNEVQIKLARLEERQNNLHRDIDHALKEQAELLRKNRPEKINKLNEEEQEKHRQEIEKLKYTLDLIGGIDPEIIEEYHETKTRFDFLDGQVKDLRKAMDDTEKIVDELDERIHKQSEKVFRQINKEFQKYFKVLFGGGSCSLVKMTQSEADEEQEHDEESAHEGDVNPALGTVDPDGLEELKKRVKERKDRVVGIDITATPPGKKLKALNLLSGGERALASIALLAAIMATNPAPFVVLDEVDAALDEANTIRFAAILDELRKKTQYIVVTHNRATMEKADVLYGVTMNDDGISQLLSVKMEEVTENGTARR